MREAKTQACLQYSGEVGMGARSHPAQAYRWGWGEARRSGGKSEEGVLVWLEVGKCCYSLSSYPAV